MAISPWEYELELTSPNGLYHAKIYDANEIAMGAPTSGTLIIEGIITINNCNPSIVWSSDSLYLAAPQWTRDRSQRLVIVDIENASLIITEGNYRVLELHSFDDGIISGVDSPIHNSKVINIDVTKQTYNT